MCLLCMKIEKINEFLNTLKALHKTGKTDFTIFCGNCGSKNCQIGFFPIFWNQDETKKNAMMLKCLDCGCAGDVPYDIEQTIYG